MNKANILVTGGLGYIGSHTSVELINNGYNVTIVDSLINSEKFILERIEKITGEKIPFYQFVSIRPLNKDLDCLRFQLDVYRVDTDNQIFNEILRKQIERGSKPHKNFMPLSRDFYMSCPTHILSVVITITDECSYDYKVNDPQKLTTIPTRLFTKDEQKVLPKLPSIDVISAHRLVGLGKSSHGKPRGITTRKTK